MQNDPITAFKYVESNIKNLVLDGSIRLGSQDFFRRFSPQSTGDPNEGKSTHNIHDTFTADDGDMRFHNHPPNVSVFKLEGDARLIMSGSQVSASTNFLIFCATLEKKDDYWANRYNPPKDSVLFIHDFRKWSQRIHSVMAQRFQIPNVSICKVQYRTEERISKTMLEGADPCRKRPDFKDEDEIRAIFQIVGDVPDYIDVKIDPRGLLEE